jgi:hypothetical protein
MRTIQPSSFNVYSINELTDEKAKKRAIENVRDEATNDEFLFEGILDDTREQLEKMGFSEPKIYFDCSYSQGSGACFVADDMCNFKRFIGAIKHMFNKEQWKALQKINRAGIDLLLSLNHRGHYYHENSVTISLDIRDYCITRSVVNRNVTDFNIEIENVINDWYKDYCRSIYRKLCDAIEYYWEDENCITYANDFEMEFTESGEIFRD